VAGLDPHTAAQVGAGMKEAFVHALSGSLKLSTAVAAAGAVLAFALVEPKLKKSRAPAASGEAQAAEPTAPTAEEVAAAA
jgi:hypothetical protein